MRTFIAVNLPEAAREQLAKLQERLRGPEYDVGPAAWPRAEGLHLTLRFLGEVTESRLKVVARVLSEISAQHEPFEMDLRGLGAFPKSHAARVLWVGVHAGAEKLKRLHRELEERLIFLGFYREDREFTPHLTVGRLRQPSRVGRAVAQLSGYEIRGVPVRSVQLMRSQLLPGGSRYEILADAPLGQGAGGRGQGLGVRG